MIKAENEVVAAHQRENMTALEATAERSEFQQSRGEGGPDDEESPGAIDVRPAHPKARDSMGWKAELS